MRRTVASPMPVPSIGRARLLERPEQFVGEFHIEPAPLSFICTTLAVLHGFRPGWSPFCLAVNFRRFKVLLMILNRCESA
jgi:hypothetical protein